MTSLEEPAAAARTTNRLLVAVGALVLVLAASSVAMGHAASATSGIEAGPWRLVAVVDQGRHQPVDPAFAAKPAVVSFGHGSVHGYDTCSRFIVGTHVDSDTMTIGASARTASTCTWDSLAWTVDPELAMRSTLERTGRVTWAIDGDQLRIGRSKAPTLVFVRDRRARTSSVGAPLDALTGTTWVPQTLTVKGVPEPVVTNSGGSGDLTFDGKGRFRWEGCGGSAGAATVTATTMRLTSGLSDLVLCSDEAGPGQVTAGQATRILGSIERPVRWNLVGQQLRLWNADGTRLLLLPPRAGWPPWSATKVAQGDVGHLPFRLGAFTLAHGSPGRSNLEIDLILQLLGSDGRLSPYGGTVFSDHSDAQHSSITMRIVSVDASHHAAMGLTSSWVARVVLTQTGRAPIDLRTHLAPGAQGVGWFLTSVPAGPTHVVGYDAAGRQVVALDRTSEGSARR